MSETSKTSGGPLIFSPDNKLWLLGHGTDAGNFKYGIIHKFSDKLVKDASFEVTMNEGSNYDSLYSGVFDSAGNLYVAGGTAIHPDGGTDVSPFINKYSPNGAEDTANWSKVFNTGNWFSTWHDIFIDSLGKIYVSGRAKNYGGSTNFDPIAKKYEQDGTEITQGWNKHLVLTNSADRSYSAAMDNLNNLYIVGQSTNYVNSSSGTDGFIKKFAADGTEETANWDKKIDEYQIRHVVVNSSREVFTFGSASNLSSGSSGLDIQITKYTEDGTQVWTKILDFNETDDNVSGCVFHDNGDFFVFGNSTNLVNSSSGQDMWIQKFSSDGNQVPNWRILIDGESGIDAIESAVWKNGLLYVSGYKTLDKGAGALRFTYLAAFKAH